MVRPYELSWRRFGSGRCNLLNHFEPAILIDNSLAVQ